MDEPLFHWVRHMPLLRRKGGGRRNERDRERERLVKALSDLRFEYMRGRIKESEFREQERNILRRIEELDSESPPPEPI